MEIRNLITFITVAELNSFTKAASMLGYSQSTISFQIKQLEEELDTLLFERINHTITLTEHGEDLLKYAKNIRQLNEEFLDQWNTSNKINGNIHIVTPDSVCEDMINSNYINFHNKYPNISVLFKTADTVEMFRMLDQNEADFIFTLDSHSYSTNHIIAKEEKVPVHFVTSSNSPYAQKRKVSIKEIANYDFILTEKGMGYRKVMDEAFARNSIEIHPILEIGRTDLIVNTLERGIGISFLPDFVTKKKVEEGKLVYIEVEDISIEIWKQLIYHKNKWISKSMEAILAYIKENEFDK